MLVLINLELSNNKGPFLAKKSVLLGNWMCRLAQYFRNIK